MGRQNEHVSLIKNHLAGALQEIRKARAAGVDLSALLPLITALVELAAEVLPELLKRKDGLEEAIDRAAKELPDDWFISVDVSKDSATTDLFHVADKHEPPPDVDGTLAEQVLALVKIAKVREASTSAVAPRD